MRAGITHQDCVDSVIARIRHCNLKSVVLVGHSFGGTVVQKVAEQVPDRIASLVFLDALILEHNQRVFDVLPSVFLDSLTTKNGDAPAVASFENTGHILPPPPWETWRDNFIQDAPEPLAQWAWEQLSPKPAQVNLDNLDLTRFYSLDIPKSLIYC